MNKFSQFLVKLKTTLKFGLIMSLFGLLIPEKSMKSLEMISHFGKTFLTKFVKIVKLSTTVKLSDTLVPLLLITDWFWTESILSMTHGITKSLVTSEPNSVILWNHFMQTVKMLEQNYRRSISRIYQRTLLTWSMTSKVSRKSISNGPNKYKNSTVQTNYWKDKDTNIPQTGSKLRKWCNNGQASSKFTNENQNNSIMKSQGFKIKL